MKTLNGFIAGFVIAAAILDWNGIGDLIMLGGICYAAGWAISDSFELGKKKELPAMRGTQRK